MFESNTHLLVTGGTGFFGLALLRHWQALGGDAPRVTVLSRDPERFAARYPDLAGLVEWVRGDVLKPDSLPHGQRYSHVLHGATDSTFGAKLSSLERYIQIVDGTRNILEFAVETGVSRFLLTSSGGVYGPQSQEIGRIPETYNGMPDPLSSHNAYSVAKRCAEHLCALYQERYGIQAVIARCFAFVGRDLPLNVHFAIGNFIRDALWADGITVSGDGTPLRSYLDQRDLAVWLMTLLEKGQGGRAYNVGSDAAISIADLAHLVRDIVSPGKPVRILGKADANGARSRYVPDIYRARAELGLEVTIQLADAIRTTAGMAKRNQEQK